MLKNLQRGLIATLAVVILTYVADDLSVRLRIPASRHVLGSVQVRKIYAVKRKNGSTEFLFDDPAAVTCVNSLVPHHGSKPLLVSGTAHGATRGYLRRLRSYGADEVGLQPLNAG